MEVEGTTQTEEGPITEFSEEELEEGAVEEAEERLRLGEAME